MGTAIDRCHLHRAVNDLNRRSRIGDGDRKGRALDDRRKIRRLHGKMRLGLMLDLEDRVAPFADHLEQAGGLGGVGQPDTAGRRKRDEVFAPDDDRMRLGGGQHRGTGRHRHAAHGGVIAGRIVNDDLAARLADYPAGLRKCAAACEQRSNCRGSANSVTHSQYSLSLRMALFHGYFALLSEHR